MNVHVVLAGLLTANRRAAGLKQTELAEMASVNIKTISQYEDPKYTGHKIRTVTRIFATLGYEFCIRLKGPDCKWPNCDNDARPGKPDCLDCHVEYSGIAADAEGDWEDEE